MRIERIGDATLYLGDCREILPSLGKIDAVVTDPPYGMAFRSNYRKNKHFYIHGDADDSLLSFSCTITVLHSRYVFCRWDNIYNCPKPHSVITWVKNNWSMGNLEHEHSRCSETLLFYAGHKHFFPHGRPADIIHAPRSENENHPTEKPVALMQAILRWTDGLVLDPFMGSGATGVAAVRLSRNFIGIEIEPKWFDLACRRIEAAALQPRFSLVAQRYEKPIQNEFLFGERFNAAAD